MKGREREQEEIGLIILPAHRFRSFHYRVMHRNYAERIAVLDCDEEHALGVLLLRLSNFERRGPICL